MARKKPPKGWTEGSVRDLLDLSDDEAAIVEMRVRLAEKVREKRRARRLATSIIHRCCHATKVTLDAHIVLCVLVCVAASHGAWPGRRNACAHVHRGAGTRH